MNHMEHCAITANDMDALAKEITTAAIEVRNGDMQAFERLFLDGGTEEGDGRINYLLELIFFRFAHRENERDAARAKGLS